MCFGGNKCNQAFVSRIKTEILLDSCFLVT